MRFRRQYGRGLHDGVEPDRREARSRRGAAIPWRRALVDQLLEVFVRHGPAQAAAVHEERRCGVDTERRRLARVGLDGVERLLAVDALLQLGDVDPARFPDLRRLSGEIVLGDLALLRVEAVVHGPELLVPLPE